MGRGLQAAPGLVCFDLDGTLTDPGIGITNSVMYALKTFGIDVEDRSRLYKFIGPPLSQSFERFYGFSPEDARAAVEAYRVYFSDKGIFENTVFEGIEALLKTLKSQNRVLALAHPNRRFMRCGFWNIFTWQSILICAAACLAESGRIRGK